ncbi:chromate transporter [Mycoplasmopsis meleagridis]|uniref:chromate transporter n=1 Tax=Mycoplasmopsis meleagridis TaxID=29561 RepID=UPI00073D24F2|nr:chromate transporter [Mycoplasmopsis meleagridis]KUH47672.1 chromate transporter [Mycoplasmopsis meleagridis]
MKKTKEKVGTNKIKDFFVIFLFVIKITLIGFGGGNALMPVIEKEAVYKKSWLTKEEFDRMVIVTNMLPGPSVIQSISYICIKKFGKFWGSILTLLSMLPHLFLALGIYLAVAQFPQKYLYVISVGVLGSIIGVLFAFGWSYMKKSKNKINVPLWVFLFLFTFIFCVFIPSPGNIPVIVMIAVFIFLGLTEYLFYKKSKRKKKEK